MRDLEFDDVKHLKDKEFDSKIDLPETLEIASKNSSSSSSSDLVQELPAPFDGLKIQEMPSSSKIEEKEGSSSVPRKHKIVGDIILELAGGRDVSRPILVVQKALVPSDVSISQNRFTIPRKQMKPFLYADDEIASTQKQEVTIIEPNLNVGTVTLVNWQRMPCDGLLLGGNWNRIARRNGLAVGMVVQLLAVRLNRELVFVLRLPAANKIQD